MKLHGIKTISLILATIGLVACATTDAPKVVETPFGDSTPYCANRLSDLTNKYNNYVSTYQHASDKLSVAPWISPDFRPINSEFFDYTKRSISPFLHAELGVPGAMMNNGVCETIFDYASNELDIDNDFIDNGTKIADKSQYLYDHYYEEKSMEGHSLTAATVAYTKFLKKITDEQEDAKVKIRENRVEMINYINNLSR